MDNAEVLTRTKEFVKKTLENEGTGHDYFHIERVHQMAQRIAKEEGDVDTFVIELAALLHDIADWKFHNGDETKGTRVANDWLNSLSADQKTIAHVCDIILNLSYKGAHVENKITTKEGMIVQDADRLDALGAIGVARAFAYGGAKNRPLYDPTIPPVLHTTSDQYKNSKSHTINHFYEKLLLLKDRMNTKTAKKIAEQRHRFLLEYLAQFYAEWNGEDSPQKPQVGVGVIVVKDDKILMGKRKGARGHGKWQLAGGRLEFRETIEECAAREVFEEAGIVIKNPRVASITNDIYNEDNSHWISIFVLAEYDSGEPIVKEPDKCESWGWFDWNSMPMPITIPMENLLKTGYSPFK